MTYQEVETLRDALAGLANLHALLGRIYDHFAQLEPQGRRWLEPETCYRAIEDPFGLLWVMGTAGRLVQEGGP